MKKKYLYTAIMLFAILVAGMGLTGWIAQDGYQTFENKKFREDPEQGYGAYSRDQCALRRKRER